MAGGVDPVKNYGDMRKEFANDIESTYGHPTSIAIPRAPFSRTKITHPRRYTK